MSQPSRCSASMCAEVSQCQSVTSHTAAEVWLQEIPRSVCSPGTRAAKSAVAEAVLYSASAKFKLQSTFKVGRCTWALTLKFALLTSYLLQVRRCHRPRARRSGDGEACADRSEGDGWR